MRFLRCNVIALVVILPLMAYAENTTPYREPQHPMRDSFTFWGWSEDGQRFAYETYSFSGGEPTDCSEAAVLIVYDAAYDRVAPSGILRRESGAEDNNGHCQIPDVRAALAEQRIEHLRRHHINVRLVLPSRFEIGQRGDWKATLHSGQIVRMQLIARNLNQAEARQSPTQLGTSYRLAVTVKGVGSREILTKSRTGALRPELDDAIAFVDPKLRFAALCIPVTYAVTHGTWTHWDCHSLKLKP